MGITLFLAPSYLQQIFSIITSLKKYIPRGTMEELKDIKDIVEVHEYSFEMLMTLIVVSIILLLILIYFIKNRRRRRKRLSPKAVALQRLKTMNYSDPKEVVYTFSQEGFLWVNEKNSDVFYAIERALIPYKYKKDIPPLDKKLAKRVETFVKGLK